MVELTQLPGFARNADLEKLLAELNTLLGNAEDQVLEDFHHPRFPLVMVVGAPRSGTTLMMQWLANSGAFAYPSNLLSRFYQAPYIGAKIQQLLTDPRFAFRDELQEWRQMEPNWENELGKTSGTLAPNEFWYFWRRFFSYPDVQFLDDAALAQVDIPTLAAELDALTSVFGKPFAFKGLMFNWNLPFMAEKFPQMVFIHTRRDPFWNAQSLLRARQKYFGTISRWYSFKPPAYEAVRDCDAFHQVAVQVMETDRDVCQGLAEIAPERHITVDYQQFCENPAMVWHRLRTLLANAGWELPAGYEGPPSFDVRTPKFLDAAGKERLRKALWSRYRLAEETLVKEGS